MANSFTITKITPNGDNSIIDWSYGENNKVSTGSSVANLSPLPEEDRQNFDIVGPWLKNEIGSEFFIQMDADLLADEGPPT